MSIADNINKVREQIAGAAARIGRKSDEITLVAVSKQKPIEMIEAAYMAGVRHFGENRSSELAEKAHALAHLDGIHWHFIGQLQTRQSLPVAKHSHAFHAVDRLKIARRLSRQLVELNRTLPVYIEVNVSGEASKSGFDCGVWEQDNEQRKRLVAAMLEIAALPQLEVQGLMTMAPFTATETVIRPIFQRTHQLAEWLRTSTPTLALPHISMGMTNDFEIAIEEGATHVRVGRAIFGARAY
ncbi:MAG: YggS family pyridoxal phosphate-dependent enzyme [Candidatus Promineifilaceae bacterium]